MFLKIKSLCCACIFLFGINAMASNNAQPGATTANPKASAIKSAEKVLGGVVTAVNQEKKEISIIRNNVAYPVLVTGATQIVSGKDPVDFSAIGVGDAVTVNYTKNADGSRSAVTVEKKSSAQPVSAPSKHKVHEKAEPKKAEAPAAAPAAPKVEVKAEPKKAEAPAAAPAAPKVEVKAEPKKAEAPAAAPAAPKVEVKAEPKKAEAPAAAPAAPKVEVKAEPKKAEAPAAPVAPKVEVKAEPKKAEAPAAPAAPKVEPKKAETPAPVKTEPKVTPK